MVRRFLSLINQELGGLHQAALLLGVSTLASQLLGLLRDRLLAGKFGASSDLDVYYAAFRIPDFMFVAVGSFLAVTVIIPMLLERETARGHQSQLQLLDSLLTVFLFIMLVTIGVAWLLLPWLLPLVAPGFSVAAKTQLLTLTGVLLLSPLLLGLSNLFGAVTQAKRRFVLYALSPLFYNLGIIAGIIYLYPSYGLLGIVYGVIFGAALHVLIQVPAILEAGLFPRVTLSLAWQDVREVFARSLPRTLALGSNQLVITVLLAVASSMAAGSIAVFTFAFNLQSVPLALIGVSYSVAAFPTMARLYAEGNRVAFLSHTTEALRHIIFWAFPVVALFIVLRAHIVRIILGSGNFSWDDTRLTAAVLAVFTISVLFQSIIQLFDRAFYAAGITREPVLIKVASSAIAILFALTLPSWIDRTPELLSILQKVLRLEYLSGAHVIVLPLAFGLGMLVNGVWLVTSFGKIFGRDSLDSTWRTVVESLLGAIVVTLVAKLMLVLTGPYVDLHHTFGVLLQALTAAIVALIAGALFLFYARSRELMEIKVSLHRRLGRLLPIFPGPEDLT